MLRSQGDSERILLQIGNSVSLSFFYTLWRKSGSVLYGSKHWCVNRIYVETVCPISIKMKSMMETLMRTACFLCSITKSERQVSICIGIWSCLMSIVRVSITCASSRERNNESYNPLLAFFGAICFGPTDVVVWLCCADGERRRTICICNDCGYLIDESDDIWLSLMHLFSVPSIRKQRQFYAHGYQQVLYADVKRPGLRWRLCILL